jgi:hypothetical protein
MVTKTVDLVRHLDDIETSDLREHFEKEIAEAETLEELTDVERDVNNVYTVRRKSEELPARYVEQNELRLTSLAEDLQYVQMRIEEKQPFLIEAWCKEYSSQVAEERELRTQVAREVIEALPSLYAKFKKLYDLQEKVQAQDSKAQVFAFRNYDVPRSSGYALPWGKPPQHTSSEREVMSAYLLATIGSALSRGQLNEEGVDVDAVLKPMPLMHHTTGTAKEVKGTA